MTVAEIIAAMSEADLERPSLRGLRLFDLESACLDQLHRECLALVRAERPSDVSNRNHVTHWTKPRGTVLQYSLLNNSGRFDDTSTDHDLSCRGKRFHAADRYPNLAALIAAFPHSANFRLNVLAPGAALSPHKEPVCFRSSSGVIGLRLRLHLAVATNPAAEVVLDGQIFTFSEGQIILFNQGCVHAARNGGRTDRLHLVWDMLLTKTTSNILFGDAPPHFPARRRDAVEQILSPKRLSAPSAFIGLTPLVAPEEVTRAQIIEAQ